MVTDTARTESGRKVHRVVGKPIKVKIDYQEGYSPEHMPEGYVHLHPGDVLEPHIRADGRVSIKHHPGQHSKHKGVNVGSFHVHPKTWDQISKHTKEEDKL